MAVHSREDITDQIDADIYATDAADVSVSKYRMPSTGLRPDVAHALVSDELILDGNSRQNLATFCSTYLDSEVHQLMDASIDKNMIEGRVPGHGRIGKAMRPYSQRSVECAQVS